MKIPFQTEGSDTTEVEFRPADNDNPAELTLVLLRGGVSVVLPPMPRVWFDHSFLKDVGLAS